MYMLFCRFLTFYQWTIFDIWVHHYEWLYFRVTELVRFVFNWERTKMPRKGRGIKIDIEIIVEVGIQGISSWELEDGHFQSLQTFDWQDKASGSTSWNLYIFWYQFPLPAEILDIFCGSLSKIQSSSMFWIRICLIIQLWNDLC